MQTRTDRQMRHTYGYTQRMYAICLHCPQTQIGTNLCKICRHASTRCLFLDIVEGAGGREPGEQGREVGGKGEETERDARVIRGCGRGNRDIKFFNDFLVHF